MVAAAINAAKPKPPKEGLRAPPLALTLLEGRGVLELAASAALIPVLKSAPKGDGHPVLVLPGFLASDRSTAPLRKYLVELEYDARGWGQGRNLGRFYQMREVLRLELEAIHSQTGQKVSLVGWSLGGIFARYLALTMPDQVRSVITLGSPFAQDMRANKARRLYDALSKEAPADQELLDQIGGDLPVPNSSIYSKLDGVVNWQTSIAKPALNAESIEIRLASHIGIGVNPAALWAIADRLAQNQGSFAPFAKKGPFWLAYG